MVKVTHIYHSGFVIEMERTVLIFGWFSGRLPDFDPAKKVVVFVTHGHPDHYSPRIWELRCSCRNITYVLECCTAPERKGDYIMHVQPGRHYDLDRVMIYTLRSNDEGVAYVVSTEGYNFFHAGDLGVWHWTDGSDYDNAYSRRTFRRQLEKISGWDFDAAMIPVDPRLGDYAFLAADDFMRFVGCRRLFPMHFWNRRQEALSCLQNEKLDPYRDRICLSEEAVL